MSTVCRRLRHRTPGLVSPSRPIATRSGYLGPMVGQLVVMFGHESARVGVHGRRGQLGDGVDEPVLGVDRDGEGQVIIDDGVAFGAQLMVLDLGQPGQLCDVIGGGWIGFQEPRLRPPSTTMRWPVTKPAPSEARKLTVWAMSVGVPMRPAGTEAR